MYRALCGSLCSCRAGEEHVPQHFLASRNLLILSLRVAAMPLCACRGFARSSLWHDLFQVYD